MELKTEKHTAYAQQLEAQLTEWKAQFALAKAKLGHVAADGNVALLMEAEIWAEHEKAAVAKLEEFKAAGEAGWETMKTGVEDAWGELRKAFESAIHSKH
jgi:hypothetical protein